MSKLIDTSYYANSVLDVSAVADGTYYTRKATNVLNGTRKTAVELGTLAEDDTALRISGKILQANPTDYYSFTLDGDNMKMSVANSEDNDNIRVQIMNSKGLVVADSQGTTSQQEAYTALTSSDGYATKAGQYYVKVTYAPTVSRSIAQTYSVKLYSGTKFKDLYNVNASAQTKSDQTVSTDDTMTYATGDAEDFTNTAYNSVNGSFLNSVQIGWLYQNKSALSLTSKLTNTNSTQYYNFTFQEGSALKLAFDNETKTVNKTNVRVQLYDTTGTRLLADSEGTEEQQEAYENLTSSTGLEMQTGNYVVKVSYGSGADKTKDQTYNFKLYSGTSYDALYETTASAQSFDNAYLSGAWAASRGYSQSSNMATFLYNQSQGSDTDIMSILKQNI